MDNKEIAIESFISYCDDMMIAEEGKIMDSIKRVINNTINKRLKNRDKSSNSNAVQTSTSISYNIKKASGTDFENLYNKEAFCAEGLKDPNSTETINVIMSAVTKWEGCPATVNFYYCSGKDLNTYYHLSEDNQYPNDLGIFFIDWSNFDLSFNASDHKGNFRYFSDVVDNNARREIRKNNPHYKNYHSLYGDEWFYSTI